MTTVISQSVREHLLSLHPGQNREEKASILKPERKAKAEERPVRKQIEYKQSAVMHWKDGDVACRDAGCAASTRSAINLVATLSAVPAAGRLSLGSNPERLGG